MGKKEVMVIPTKFYVSYARAEKLIEADDDKYGKDTIIIGCEEIPNGIGYLVKGDDIVTVILDYNDLEM